MIAHAHDASHPMRLAVAGFSLVEVTIALGLAAFGIIAIFALLPTGINSGSDAVNTTIAANLASVIVSDLQATSPTNTNGSVIYGVRTSPPPTILYLGTDGTTNASTALETKFKAEVTLSPPTNDIARVQIVVSWPAQAANPANKFEIVTALDRSTAP